MTGLTTSEVEERRARGEGETGARSVTKSTGAILRENICTLFNALNFAIAILLFAVGAYSNMLFIAIIILNIVIGIVQEFKAKKLVDELTILNQPHAVVLRDGKETTIEAGDIVKDDVMVLDSGKQICNDAVVIDGRLEVNESLLTGESDSIDKTAGSELYSGQLGDFRPRVRPCDARRRRELHEFADQRGAPGEARALRAAGFDAQGHPVHQLPDHPAGRAAVRRGDVPAALRHVRRRGVVRRGAARPCCRRDWCC